MATRHDILQKLATQYATAWSSGDPALVAEFFTDDAKVSVNGDTMQTGTQAIAELAAGFYAEFPDLELRCDLMRAADQRCMFVWTLEGHHARTGNHVVIGGWQDWQLDGDTRIRQSLIWFDADDCQRQIAGR